jgi:hypothetical protein
MVRRSNWDFGWRASHPILISMCLSGSLAFFWLPMIFVHWVDVRRFVRNGINGWLQWFWIDWKNWLSHSLLKDITLLKICRSHGASSVCPNTFVTDIVNQSFGYKRVLVEWQRRSVSTILTSESDDVNPTPPMLNLPFWKRTVVRVLLWKKSSSRGNVRRVFWSKTSQSSTSIKWTHISNSWSNWIVRLSTSTSILLSDEVCSSFLLSSEKKLKYYFSY